MASAVDPEQEQGPARQWRRKGVRARGNQHSRVNDTPVCEFDQLKDDRRAVWKTDCVGSRGRRRDPGCRESRVTRRKG